MVRSVEIVESLGHSESWENEVVWLCSVIMLRELRYYSTAENWDEMKLVVGIGSSQGSAKTRLKRVMASEVRDSLPVT